MDLKFDIQTEKLLEKIVWEIKYPRNKKVVFCHIKQGFGRAIKHQMIR